MSKAWQVSVIAGNIIKLRETPKKIEFNNNHIIYILKYNKDIEDEDEYDNINYDFECLITKLKEKSV